MSRRLRLVEYRTTHAVELTDWEASVVRRMVPSVGVAPSASIGRWDLTPGSKVGGVSIGGLEIEIHPKIGMARLLFLLSYALDPRWWQARGFDFASERGLLEAVIPGFVLQLRRAFRRGPIQGYISRDDSSLTIRGRIRFDDQLRDRFGLFPPAEVRYDEFTEDVELNRILKAALARLSKLRLRSGTSRSSLRAFDALLRDVSLVEYDPRQLPTFDWDRRNAHYRPAVELAMLFLKSTSYELGDGEVRASAFLVDMNAAFEDFVVVALREALGLSETQFPQGARGRRLRLDQEARVRLEPDISWWDRDRCVFVGDAKYKRIEAAGIKHADLYQLLSYAVAADLRSGLLIYAEGEAQAVSHSVVHLGKQLHVTTLGLGGSPEEILARIDRLALQIRRLRDEAMRGRPTLAA